MKQIPVEISEPNTSHIYEINNLDQNMVHKHLYSKITLLQQKYTSTIRILRIFMILIAVVAFIAIYLTHLEPDYLDTKALDKQQQVISMMSSQRQKQFLTSQVVQDQIKKYLDDKINLLYNKLNKKLQQNLNSKNGLLSDNFKKYQEKYQMKFNNFETSMKQMDQTIEFLVNSLRFQVYKKRSLALATAQVDKGLNWRKDIVPLYIRLENLNHAVPFTSQVQERAKKIQFQRATLQQYNYYDKKYNISSITQQLPFCIIIPTWNNAADLRYQLNLKSILNQNYTNFHIHISDDLSSDSTYNLLQRYLKKNNIPTSKVTLDKVNERSFILKNIIQTAKKYCKDNQIVAVIDGDDQLLGVNVLKLFNSFYSKEKLGVVYSTNLKFFPVTNKLIRGYSWPFSAKEINSRTFRKAGFKHSQLRTYKAQLLFSIKDQDFKQNGKYFQFGSDNALMYPMQQMSCGKLKYIDQMPYFVNSQTNNNDFQKNYTQQRRVQNYIKSKQVYPCHINYA